MELTTIKQRFGIIGHSDLLNRALEVALRVAPTDLTVLVSGESGVGKEFFPQVIHSHSSRKHNKYIAVNCGAIPEGTIDSELFGHEKGAFTGAVEMRRGYFEEADGGTIFLDEVGELPLPTQVRLLRVLQSGEFIRVGSTKVQKTNVRVVAATNVRLEEAIAEGRFREDLYYRLNTVPITVPALRERREDIYMLFRKFSSDVATRYRMPAITLDEGARALLEGYYWRGNIRQLKNIAEQISAVETSRVITADILSRYLPQSGAEGASVVARDDLRRGDSEGYAGEREILYKVLFDMRSEIGELRRMVAQLLANEGLATPSVGAMPVVAPQLQQALPSHDSGVSRPIVGIISSTSDTADLYAPEYFAESEEVRDDEVVAPREQTKADMQREQITRALRRHNGRRKDAAAELFMSERTLYRRIKELGIEEL
ncbi:MAG: sigma 54-interacting transcriptional regulator [Rikenellaceae bacterium]